MQKNQKLKMAKEIVFEMDEISFKDGSHPTTTLKLVKEELVDFPLKQLRR